MHAYQSVSAAGRPAKIGRQRVKIGPVHGLILVGRDVGPQRVKGLYY